MKKSHNIPLRTILLPNKTRHRPRPIYHFMFQGIGRPAPGSILKQLGLQIFVHFWTFGHPLTREMRVSALTITAPVGYTACACMGIFCSFSYFVQTHAVSLAKFVYSSTRPTLPDSLFFKMTSIMKYTGNNRKCKILSHCWMGRSNSHSKYRSFGLVM